MHVQMADRYLYRNCVSTISRMSETCVSRVGDKVYVDVLKVWTCPDCGVDTCFEHHDLRCPRAVNPVEKS